MAEHIIVHDDGFLPLLRPGAKLERIMDGMVWAEGPVYFPQGDYFLWSDIPNNRSYQWINGGGFRIYSDASNNCNGHTRDREGRLISCEHLTRRVTRTEHDGSTTVIADSFEGKRLNSPNDVVVKSDGTIWFTDPPYGIMSNHEGQKAPQEQNGCYVFCVDPESGDIRIVADDFIKPNGLAFSPNEEQLYITDTGKSHDPDGPHHIRVFDVSSNGRFVDCRLENGNLFVEINEGVPDGLKVDRQGNIWTSSAIGVQCYTSKGHHLGTIKVPEVVSNLTFGGKDGNSMLITATTSAYIIQLGTINTPST